MDLKVNVLQTVLKKRKTRPDRKKTEEPDAKGCQMRLFEKCCFARDSCKIELQKDTIIWMPRFWLRLQYPLETQGTSDEFRS